jgi:hypothetical protein
MVGSGTRNARVISAVVSPPRRRRVSATGAAVDRPVAGGGDDPSRWARGQSDRRPPLHRCGERVLDRLLGEVEVTEDTNQDGYRVAVLLAEHALDHRGGHRRHTVFTRMFRPAKA